MIIKNIWVINMIVDSREPNWVKDAFPDAIIQRLEIGDIASDDLNTIIERKHITDLASSIMDGRYKNQIATLMNYQSFYIVIGEAADLIPYHSKMVKSTFSAINSIQMKYRIPLFHVKTENEFVEKVKTIMKKRENLESELIQINKVKADPHLRILCSLPNISVKKAKVIREKYDSIAEALTHVKDWHELDGIGQGIVDKCVEALECEYIEVI